MTHRQFDRIIAGRAGTREVDQEMETMTEFVFEALVGHGLWLPLAVFLLLGAVIFAVASRLAHAADAISDATGLGRAWIGAILLAGSTSLPEITIDVNAAVLGVPDIGVGDLMGSTLANMLILALLDLVYRRRQLLQRVEASHAVVGLLAIALTMIAGVAIAAGGFGSVGFVGVETILIVAVYILGMRMFYRLTAVAAEGASPAVPAAARRAAKGKRPGLRAAIWTFGIAAAVLVVISPLLVISAEAVSAESGMSETFIGTLLVGLTTSFPEIATTVAAVRLGAIDLAVGNIFGSNAFNMCVLLLMDLAYTDGPILADVSGEHVMTAQLATLAIAFGVLAVMGRVERRSVIARFESLLIIGCYGAGVWLLARG